MSDPVVRNNHLICPLCGQSRRRTEFIPGDLVHGPVLDLLRKNYRQWDSHQSICRVCLNQARSKYVQTILEEEKGELTALENDVIASLREHELLSKNINSEFDRQLTLGERLADGIADFGGSWFFILSFSFVLVGWIALNSIGSQSPFDPYPFILLNLVLSCLAAIQAPVIMMSQNRQEAKDRLRSEHDYRVNLKAELEIQHLNSKMDQLLTHQWSRLLEIQNLQVELMQELSRRQR